eukprot:scaffold18654_cov66-Phaeocystis_antarctica.AAC.1
MGGVGGPRARAIETAGRWFGPLAQRKPRPAKDKAFAEIRRAWHFVDAKGEILGRLAAKIAPLLCGKHKPIFQSARDVGDYVVVTNVEQIEITGKNNQNKLYYRHSGFAGGLKAMTFDQLFTKNPVEPLRRAINGMLPKNKLRYQRMRRSMVKAPRLAAHPATRRSGGPPACSGPRVRDSASRLARRGCGGALAPAQRPRCHRAAHCAALYLQAAVAALPGRGAPARGAAQLRQPGLRRVHAALAHGPLLAYAGQDQASGDALTARRDSAP